MDCEQLISNRRAGPQNCMAEWFCGVKYGFATLKDMHDKGVCSKYGSLN